MKLITDFIDGFKAGQHDKRQRVNAHRAKQLEKEMQERIQIKEHQGKLFISVDGTPIIDADLLRLDLVEALSDIRTTIIQYKCPTT